MAYQKDANDLGTLWENFSKANRPYFKGTINGVEVIGWPKTLTNGKNIINIVKSVPRENQGGPAKTTPPPVADQADGDLLPF